MAGRRRRRRQVLALSGAAAAMAGVMALTPLVSGSKMPPGGFSFLNVVEGSGFDHNGAHRPASPDAVARAEALAAACEDGADGPLCPEPAPTARQARTAQVEGARVSVQATTQPDGLWGALAKVPSTAIHSVVLPTNKVLWFSQPKGVPGEALQDGGNAHVWDPATGESRAVPPPVVDFPADAQNAAYSAPANLWCGGQVLLADGRVLVVGGNLAYPYGGDGAGAGAGSGFRGGAWVMTFDPWTETWTKYQDMESGGRWYPTLTLLPDGRVLIVGGWDETGGLETAADPAAPPTMVNNQSVEVFDPATPPGGLATTELSRLPPHSVGQTDPWPDHQGLGLYPHMFQLPDTTVAGAGGTKVLVAGPNQWDSAIIDTRTGLWEDVFEKPYALGTVPLSSDRAWGTAYLEPSGPEGSRRVVMLGGSNSGAAAPGPGQSPPPLATAEVLDLDAPDEGWQITPELALRTGRAHFNTVLLPDGGILSNGGGFGRFDDSLYADPIYEAELYEPGQGWRTIGREEDARTYHSTSVLLPDGRVLSAGDDRDTPSAISDDHLAVENRTAQVWSPPYLFDGPRPAVTYAPDAVRYDAPFRVTVQGDPGSIARAVLMRPGAVTHSVDMSQQSITLDLAAQADGLTLTTPLNATVAPPGYYMLFLLDGSGVPSVASWIRLDPRAPDAPAPPADPPPAPAPTAANPVPVPATAAPTTSTPRVALRLSTWRPAVRMTRTRVRVTVRLRSSVRGRAVVTLRRPGGRVVGRRAIALAAGRRLSPRLTVRRASIRGARRLTVRVQLRDALGRRASTTRAAPLPRRG